MTPHEIEAAFAQAPPDFSSPKEPITQARLIPGPPTGRWLPCRITKIDHPNIERTIDD
jgi:hypothetical protein